MFFENNYEYSDNWKLCETQECWCKATIVNSTFVQLPYSIMDDIIENGFINVQTLDFLIKAFEATV
jgi:hypothetical protein